MALCVSLSNQLKSAMNKSFFPILFLIFIVGCCVALFGLRSAETTNDTEVTIVQASTEDVQINTENLKTVTLDVPTMSCISCPYAVRKSLINILGVADVKASLLTRTIVVLFD